MKKLVLIAVSLSIGFLLGYSFEASAHGKDPHDDHRDVQMRKLHAMMPMFSMALAELETDIEKGDATAVTVQTDKILTALPDLKKSKPHKNLKQITAYKKIATEFGDNVLAVRKLAINGDFGAAKEAFDKVESRCAECHTRFKD